ncbi:MAG: MFS transporter [Opitutae bacterium]|nr:MFS transporter [Opitutae bacterium]
MTESKQTPPPGNAATAAPTAPTKPTWSVGTLTYTSGGLVLLFCWLLWGDVGYFIADRSIYPSMQVMLKKYQASDLVTGLLLTTVPQIITMFLLPMVNLRSDRHRGRFGRRIPFILGTVPFAFAALFGLACTPELAPWLIRTLALTTVSEKTVVILLFGTFFTLFEFSRVTCYSVFNGLANDVVPRAMISRFFALFRVFSLGAGMFYGHFLFAHVKTHLFTIFVSIGALYAVSVTMMCLFIKEGSYPPPAQTSQNRGFIAGMKTYLRDCFTQPIYIWTFVSITLTMVAFAPINVYSYYLAESLNVSEKTFGDLIALQLLISLAQSYPVGWLADKFHPVRLTIVALALYTLAILFAFLFVKDATTFCYAFVICGSFAGTYLTASTPLGPVLFPKAKFGTFDSAKWSCISLGTMLVGPACGKLLDFSHHQYRYIYLIAFCFVALSLLATLVVYKEFMKLGGPKGYQAPE